MRNAGPLFRHATPDLAAAMLHVVATARPSDGLTPRQLLAERHAAFLERAPVRRIVSIDEATCRIELECGHTQGAGAEGFAAGRLHAIRCLACFFHGECDE